MMPGSAGPAGRGGPIEPSELAVELEFALDLADRCDTMTLRAFEQREFSVEWKANHTEVTEVDRACETLVVDAVARHRPDHGVYGEEFGTRAGTGSTWQWIIDPIDGTSGFTRGQPSWATLIALEHVELGVAVAVISAPALQRRWWASLGQGSWVNGEPCRVSAIDSIAEAHISITYNSGWDDLGLTGRLVDLGRRTRRVRGFGDFWQHCLVAEGALDIAIDAVGVAPYDLAAVGLVVTEAGGVFTDRHGVATHRHDTAVSSNGVLHPVVIDALSP
jgi:histidinol-phosphatase